MNLPKTSFNEKSHEKYVIDAAVLLANLKWQEGGWTFEELGATEGSVSVEVEMAWRQMEVNGAMHLDVKEHAILETFGATATSSVKEMSAKILQQAINGKVEEANGEAPDGWKKIVPQRFTNDETFLENIAFVGRLSSHSNQSVIFVLDNPKVDEGLSGETEDGGEMAIEQVYRAHASVKQLVADIDYLPLRIYLPGELNVEGRPAQMNIAQANLPEPE